MPQELNFESEKIEFWEKMTPADNPGELAGMQQMDQKVPMTFQVFIANNITA